MKLKPRIIACAFLLGLLLPFVASAYYSPEQGRWISRDPIGHRGGLNLYGMGENRPVDKVDYLGLQFFYPGPIPPPFMCPFCLCLSADVKYTPGGSAFQLGFVQDPKPPFPWPGPIWLWGNHVKVAWNVLGNPKLCKYYQDEGRTHAEAKGPNGPINFQGRDGNEVEQVSDDYPGFYPDAHGFGKYFDSMLWDVTFRCESFPRTLPGASRHDGPWLRTKTFRYPDDLPPPSERP